MKLSILIPSVPTRNPHRHFKSPQKDVETLCLIDDYGRSIGLKRQALLDIAQGDYVMWLDDDDDISKNFSKEILKAAKSNPDVITFKEQASMNGDKFIVTYGLGNEVEETGLENGKLRDIKRPPWIRCAWKRELIKDVQFPDSNYGEDGVWAAEAVKKVKTEVHIDKILYYYNWDEKITEAK